MGDSKLSRDEKKKKEAARSAAHAPVTRPVLSVSPSPHTGHANPRTHRSLRSTRAAARGNPRRSSTEIDKMVQTGSSVACAAFLALSAGVFASNEGMFAGAVWLKQVVDMCAFLFCPMHPYCRMHAVCMVSRFDCRLMDPECIG